MPNELVVPVEMPETKEPPSIADAAASGREIGANWRKAVEGVLKTGELCTRALQLYGTTGLPVVLRAAQMSRPTFMKLVVIGRDSRLRPIETLLPPNYSIIHQISQLDDGELDQAVKAGVIRTDLRRAEIEALRKLKVTKGERQTQGGELPGALKGLSAGARCELAIPADIRPVDCEQMRRVLCKLHAKYGIQIATIKDLDPVSEPSATPGNFASTGSPGNLPMATQAFVPSKLPEPGASPAAKSST